MAPRGPKPKPTRLKVLSGTARPHRLNPAEPVIVAEVPDAPDHLTDPARREWERVTAEMAEAGILSALDRGALAAYAQTYGRWVAAERALETMATKDRVTAGLVIRTKSGNAIQNPLVGTANKAMADMVRYAAEFGFDTVLPQPRLGRRDPRCGRSVRPVRVRPMARQTRLLSLVEAVANVAIGFVVALLTQMAVFPAGGDHDSRGAASRHRPRLHRCLARAQLSACAGSSSASGAAGRERWHGRRSRSRETQRAEVETLAALLNQDQIADYFGIAPQHVPGDLRRATRTFSSGIKGARRRPSPMSPTASCRRRGRAAPPPRSSISRPKPAGGRPTALEHAGGPTHRRTQGRCAGRLLQSAPGPDRPAAGREDRDHRASRGTRR